MSRRGTIITIFSVLFLTFYMVSCTNANKELMSAEEALRMAAEEGASDTQEYMEAEELIAKAKALMAEGNHDEARKVLEEARFKAIAAIGAAKSVEYEETVTEVDQEMEKQILVDSREVMMDVNLVDIFFDYDQSSVRADAQQALDQNATSIITGKINVNTVALEGYCDTRGTEEYNLALGQRRAESVKSYLIGMGVSPSLLQAVSRGETEKWGTGSSEYAYQQNRRVHFVPLSN